jgi:hypothetical protein
MNKPVVGVKLLRAAVAAHQPYGMLWFCYVFLMHTPCPGWLQGGGREITMRATMAC